MSEPARQHPANESSLRPSNAPGPLRDWLAAMRAVAAESKSPEQSASEVPSERQGWAPRLVGQPKAEQQDEQQDEDVAEIVAENLMLKAKLRLEAERRDELQILLAQEIRDMRAEIEREVADLEDLRAERDLWKSRCEALMQPLFQRG